MKRTQNAQNASAPRVGTYRNGGATYWCDDCAVAHVNAGAHVGDVPDAILGTRGVLRGDIAYVWDHARTAYRYRNMRATDRIPRHHRGSHAGRSHNVGGAGLVNDERLEVAARPLRITPNAAASFVRAYDEQRSHHRCIGSATASDHARALAPVA